MPHSETIEWWLSKLDKHQRAHAEDYIASHPDYPFGELALCIDAEIYAEFMVKERPWVDVVPASNSD